MIRPLLCATITRPTAWQMSQHALRLTSITCCHSASVYSSEGLRMMPPTSVTRMSIRPNR